MSEKKKVIVFTTGGTIAMKFDPKVNGLVPAVSGADLAAAVPGLDKLADVEVREFSNHASCAMTPQKMFQLSQMIEEALKEEGVAGAVVTHGTDTVEETAYMLDILHKSEKPIVLTAAMRGAGDTSPDGPANIYCAVKTAASEEAKGKGVMVLLNEIIHAAIPAKMRERGGHPSKKTFQAIRIACNRELDVLQNSLDGMIDFLNPQGRICVITFHSLEDRIVKVNFRKNENPCTCPPEFPVCICGNISKGRVITRKPVLPSDEELSENKRSKSAKLRAFEKKDNGKEIMRKGER